MKRLIFLASMFLFVTLSVSAQKKYAVYGVGFYNQ